MPASSSSSSDDEDFSKFASCAVSADQLEKDAQVEAKKRSVKRSAAAIGGGPTAAPSKKPDGDEDEPTSAGVDAVSAKIAAALDAILARDFDPSGSKQTSQAAGSIPHSDPVASIPKAADPTAASANPAADHSTADDATGVQLFRAVPKGTPCIVQQQRYDLAMGSAMPTGQQQHPEHTSGGFGSDSIPRRQPLRDQIPCLSLAERSRTGSKRKHEKVLAKLTVDGPTLLAEAAAAGYAGQAGSTNSSSKGRTGPTGNGSSTAVWLKGWKRLKGQKAQGEVVEAKEFVPFDVRAAKLVGA